MSSNIKRKYVKNSETDEKAPKKIKPTCSSDKNSSFAFTNCKPWTVEKLLAERSAIDSQIAKNIVDLFNDENTIPFICRYRRDLITEDITPERLRDIKNSYNEILSLQKRANVILKQIEKDKLLNESIKNEILSAKTSEELEFLYAPYKPANKGSLADRAKALGLDYFAEQILYGKTPPVQLHTVVNQSVDGLESIEKVFEGIKNIVSHVISKNTSVLEFLRDIQEKYKILLKCSKAKSSSKGKHEKTDKLKSNKTDEKKYELYYNFENNIKFIKPHQILAINRAEKAKIITVKIIVPDIVKTHMKRFIYKEFFGIGITYNLRSDVFETSFEDCYNKKLQPLLCRQIRSDLCELAKKASIDVFTKNVKQLLLTSPLKGEKILGIDPGFTNGCKLALISETSELLETDVIFPHTTSDNKYSKKLSNMLNKHKCKIIALGNGTACRETELWLTKLFDENILNSKIVKYSIVSEQGASIYSCSDIAKKEFPNIDINLISAVSIARRLNDPLSEYVKIDPKHIGVGMYQHDLTSNILTDSLEEVVMECVSFVGVDINTASLSILKYISGLTEIRANKIIDYRTKNGPFTTRKDLLKVKGIGEKIFTQCSGFIRIEPKTLDGRIENRLDCTSVHPESYKIAEKIIKKLKLKIDNIGEQNFITTIKNFNSIKNLENLAEELKMPKERISVILESLGRKLFQDYREEIDTKPLFKQRILRISDLKRGSIVTGAVTNITHFGAFVDVGVEHNGLIHSSNMNGETLVIGDRVSANVIEIDIKRKRIQLKLQNKLK